MEKYRPATEMLFLASAVYHNIPKMAAVAEQLAPVFQNTDNVSPSHLAAALYLFENMEEAISNQGGTYLNTLNQCIQLLQDELWV